MLLHWEQWFPYTVCLVHWTSTLPPEWDSSPLQGSPPPPSNKLNAERFRKNFKPK